MVMSLQTSCIYGPVSSRRLGRSLGLNVLPTDRKVCTFECVYCQYGPSGGKPTGLASGYPDVFLLARELEESLRALLARHEHLDAITFSGNGEPTIHPRFESIVDEVIRLRNRFMPDVPVTILSNSTTAGRPSVRAALLKLDQRIMKLDAGSQAVLEMVNQPRPSVRLADIIDGLRQLDCVSVQSAFMTGSHDNTGEQAVEAWVEAIATINPSNIQIYTIDRPSADGRLLKADRSVLDRIAVQVMKKTGVTARVF